MNEPEQGKMEPAAYEFDPEILREYDIRGLVGKSLKESDAYTIGLAFGTKIRRAGGSRVCVGYDGRHSSISLSDALIKGLVATGVDVDNIGLGPTPMLYFAVKDKMFDGGIMVTGSHNPPEYNGFKLTLQSSPVFGKDIKALGEVAAAGDFEVAEKPGTVRRVDVSDMYVERLIRDFTGTRKVKIAWDSGNGSAGAVLHKLVSKLPGQHTLLFDDVDGDFPNHHPDPVVDENLVDLQKVVEEQNCDFGIAFDGDGDRIGIVDENGDIIRCDILMAIYAKEVLADNPEAVIIGDVKCSNVMFDEIARLGGTPLMWKTGHSLVKAKMAETKALLAGELSGHIFFADKYYGYDDALYCAVRLIGILCDSEEPLSAMISHLPKLYSTPELRIDVPEAEKFNIVEKMVADLKSRESDDLKVDTTDGIRVKTPDGWWLLRASNTQPALVARAEGSSRGGIDRLKEMLKEEAEKLGYDVSF